MKLRAVGYGQDYSAFKLGWQDKSTAPGGTIMLEPSPLLLLIYVLPVLLSALVLYVVVRFGVKHGMRSYYAESKRSPGD